jgi:hypothetical protein
MCSLPRDYSGDISGSLVHQAFNSLPCPSLHLIESTLASFTQLYGVYITTCSTPNPVLSSNDASTVTDSSAARVGPYQLLNQLAMLFLPIAGSQSERHNTVLNLSTCSLVRARVPLSFPMSSLSLRWEDMYAQWSKY